MKTDVKFTSWRKKGMWVLDLSESFGGLGLLLGRRRVQDKKTGYFLVVVAEGF